MPDNLNNPGPEDGKRISLAQDHEVAYWCSELKCTREELAAAVALKGHGVAAVRAHFAGLPR